MSPSGRQRLAFCVALLGIALLYGRSLPAPFVFDDKPNIVHNPALRDWPPARDLRFSGHPSGVAGRPTFGASLCLNFRVAGEAPLGFRAVNLFAHLLAVALLFGLLRRTLQATQALATASATPFSMALVVASLWGVHPLLSESVVYIHQRTGLFAGLFLLATLYAALRSWQSPSAKRWQLVAVLCCAAGMGSKEVMVVAPFLVLLFQRAYFAPSFAAALRSSALLYLGLLGCWGYLAYLMMGLTDRHLIGLDLDVTPLDYLRTQAGVLLFYLRLSFVPTPLAIVHKWPAVESWGAAIPAGGVVVLLVVGCLAGFLRRPAVGFLGLAFFVLLAPESSFVPVAAEFVAERRMYLPLALIVLLVALLVVRWIQSSTVLVALWLLSLLGLSAGTWQRLGEYETEASIWEAALRDYPDSAVVHNGLGTVLAEQGKRRKALESFRKALDLAPGFGQALNNAGSLLYGMGEAGEAVRLLERAVALEPRRAFFRENLGRALLKVDRPQPAITHLEEALALGQRNSRTYHLLGSALLQAADLPGAVQVYRQILSLNPQDSVAHNNLAGALVQLQRYAEAIPHYEQALRLQPGDGLVEKNLAAARQALPNR
jgi:Flp pilus assembly protein TadD